MAVAVDFEGPTDPTEVNVFRNGEPLPVVGGPLDGETLAVPVMFGFIVPGFARHGNHMYQLDLWRRRWRFIFTIGRGWASYRRQQWA